MKRSRVFLLAAYPVGVQVTEWLKSYGEDIVGLAVHPPSLEHSINRGCTAKIIAASGLPEERIYAAEALKEEKYLEEIRRLEPDLILAVFWGYLLQPALISIPKIGCVNFHCAYLPYNRGANPNIWSIIDGTPAGATLHWIDPGIDSGDIIAQTQVSVEPVDTGATLYQKMINCFMPLFIEHWPAIKAGTAPRIKQDLSKMTFHRRKDRAKLDVIDLEKTYTGRELIDLLRARTFEPFPSAYFIDSSGRRVGVRVSLEYLNV